MERLRDMELPTNIRYLVICEFVLSPDFVRDRSTKMSDSFKLKSYSYLQTTYLTSRSRVPRYNYRVATEAAKRNKLS